MLTFWSLSSISLVPVPRSAHLRPPPPYSIHRPRLRLQLGLGVGRRFAPWRVGASEEASGPPGGVVDQAGAALYGLPPALAVQGLHVGFGHHHLGVGGGHARLVLRLDQPAEKSASKRNERTSPPPK